MTVFVLASLPFLLGAAVLFAMSNRASGWDAMNLGIYAGVALLGWAALVIGFLIWLVIRDGLVASNILPLAILGSLVCAALWWGGSWWLQENACSRDAAFYDAIAAAPLEQRAAMVEDARNNPAEITRCGRDSLVYHFGRDLFDSLAVGSTAEHERLATWALLLEHGLPADDPIFHGAVNNADSGLVRLLIEKRLDENHPEAIPSGIVQKSVSGVEMNPDGPYHAHTSDYLEILRIFFALGLDPCRRLGADGTVIEAMKRRDVPDDVWQGTSVHCETS